MSVIRRSFLSIAVMQEAEIGCKADPRIIAWFGQVDDPLKSGAVSQDGEVWGSLRLVAARHPAERGLRRGQHQS